MNEKIIQPSHQENKNLNNNEIFFPSDWQTFLRVFF